ncbi:MAG: cyclase family protein [Lachnospiraceae bacterium]
MSIFVELSHQLNPGNEEYELSIQTHKMNELYAQYNVDESDWYIMQIITLNAHVGTHVESPYHHRKDGCDISQVPLENLVGKLVCLDFTYKKCDEVIVKEEIIQMVGERNIKDKIVFFHTGRDEFYYAGKEGHERPYPDTEAIVWLIEQKITCLGIDATGIEVKGIKDQPNHKTLFAANIPLVENLTNLSAIDSDEYTVYILPLCVSGMESCPVRVIAISEGKENC